VEISGKNLPPIRIALRGLIESPFLKNLFEINVEVLKIGTKLD